LKLITDVCNSPSLSPEAQWRIPRLPRGGSRVRTPRNGCGALGAWSPTCGCLQRPQVPSSGSAQAHHLGGVPIAGHEPPNRPCPQGPVGLHASTLKGLCPTGTTIPNCARSCWNPSLRPRGTFMRVLCASMTRLLGHDNSNTLPPTHSFLGSGTSLPVYKVKYYDSQWKQAVRAKIITPSGPLRRALGQLRQASDTARKAHALPAAPERLVSPVCGRHS